MKMGLKKGLKLTFKKLKTQFGHSEDDYYPNMKNTQSYEGVTIDEDLLARILLQKYKKKLFSNEPRI